MLIAVSVFIMRGPSARSTHQRRVFLRCAYRQTRERSDNQSNDEGQERRLVTASNIVDKPEERRAHGTERVRHENTQTAHHAEGDATEVGRPNQFLQHPAAAQTDAVKKKAQLDRRDVAGDEHERQARRLNQKHD